MDVREWALICFTILAQMSVGAFVVLGVVHFFAARKAGMQEADRLSDRALLAIIPVMALALVVSLLHLGNPINAYRAVGNLGSSWLSREILFGVLFTLAAAVFAFAQWRKISTFAVRSAIAILAAILGLALVYAMSNIYMLPTQPVWNMVTTPISFFAATLLLGMLAIGAAFVVNYAYVQGKDPSCAEAQCELLRGSLRWIALAAILVLGVELVVAPIEIAALAGSPTPAARAGADLMFNQYGIVLALRLILAFLGAGIFGLFIYQTASSPGREKVLGYVAFAAFALVLVAEVLSRYLFYASHVRVGI